MIEYIFWAVVIILFSLEWRHTCIREYREYKEARAVRKELKDVDYIDDMFKKK